MCGYFTFIRGFTHFRNFGNSFIITSNRNQPIYIPCLFVANSQANQQIIKILNKHLNLFWPNKMNQFLGTRIDNQRHLK